MKDDNLGLGARNGARNDDGPTTGLDGLQHLLGRLNGKDEKLLEKEQRCREDTKRTLYAERRWGLGSFVSGGFLVKDRIQDRVDVSLERVAPTNSLSDKGSKKVSKSKLHKTRKEKSEKARESMPLHGTVTLAQGSSSATSSQSKNPSGIDNEPDAEQPGTSEDSTLKANRRLAKMERRAQRKARNAEKAAARALEQTTREPPDSIPSAGEAKTQVSEAARTHGRHAVRQRFIQHKKMSLADQKALNEVCWL